MKPTKSTLKEEIEHRIALLEETIDSSDQQDLMRVLCANEHSMYTEFLNLINLFERRNGYETMRKDMYTPIKDYVTKEPLKIGDRVKANTTDANGILYFDEYLNQYVIRTDFGTHNKPSGFIKIEDNFDYSIDNTKAECRPNPGKKRW